MKKDTKISALVQLGLFLNKFLNQPEEEYSSDEQELETLMSKSEIENPWFTQESLRFALGKWADLLKEDKILQWLSTYRLPENQKKVGLILAGNIPLVGLHDIISVILSQHFAVIKLSSKDKCLIPFLMKKWEEFLGGKLPFAFVDKLENYDAVIATGSNNTARYLEYYFGKVKHIIRKNRTSVAVLDGTESDEELQLLAEDIFRYYGLGCRNVTRLFIPESFKINCLFENFLNFKDIINHHKYANNYDYNRAVYLLNQEKFWDNNFVMLKEDTQLFSPLSVINFSRYKDLEEVKEFLALHREDIQCIVAKTDIEIDNTIPLGQAQNPSLDTYADNVDTMVFLCEI